MIYAGRFKFLKIFHHHDFEKLLSKAVGLRSVKTRCGAPNTYFLKYTTQKLKMRSNVSEHFIFVKSRLSPFKCRSNHLKEVFFLDVKMSFLTNVVESVCVCRMITRVGALESLHPEDTFSYL